MIEAVFRQAYGNNPELPRLASNSSERLRARSRQDHDAPRAWQTWATSSASARRSVGPARRLPLAGFPGGSPGPGGSLLIVHHTPTTPATTGPVANSARHSPSASQTRYNL